MRPPRGRGGGGFRGGRDGGRGGRGGGGRGFGGRGPPRDEGPPAEVVGSILFSPLLACRGTHAHMCELTVVFYMQRFLHLCTLAKEMQ